jgi:chromosome segregation ATPase
MDDVAATMARYEMRRIDDRIAAAHRLMAANAEMTDAERGRFLAYIERLQNQRAEIDLSVGDGTVERMDQMTDARINSAADYRLSNTERMLQAVDGKMDRMGEQLSDHSSRLRVLEDRMSALSNKVDHLSGQIDHLRAAPGYSRTALAVGAAVMLVMLLLLLFVTWRLV